MDPFLALADPTRRRIIETLCSGERSFGELAEQFEISRPAVSQHLKVLKQNGIVGVRAEAQRRYYRLTPEGLVRVDAWLERVRRFWPERLEQLRKVLEQPDE